MAHGSSSYGGAQYAGESDDTSAVSIDIPVANVAIAAPDPGVDTGGVTIALPAANVSVSAPTPSPSGAVSIAIPVVAVAIAAPAPAPHAAAVLSDPVANVAIAAPSPSFTVAVSLPLPPANVYIGAPPPRVQTTAAPLAAPVWSVKVVDRTGTTLGTFTAPTVASLGWKLNAPAEASISALPMDPGFDAMPIDQLPEFEVQVWREGTNRPVWWGRWISPSGGRSGLSWTCEDLLGYFWRRFIGAPRKNYLRNGSFDADAVGATVITDWTKVVNGGAIVDGAIVDNNQIAGGKALQINNDLDDTDSYYTQMVTDPAICFASPTPAILAGWIYPAAFYWIGPAFGGQFLVAIACDTAGNFLDAYMSTLDDNTAQDAWSYPPVVVGRPPGLHHYLIRIYSAGGREVVDECVLVLPESLSWPTPTDECEIAESLSVHLQDPVIGKSDLNIGRSHTTSGVPRTRTWQFADMTNGGDVLTEFCGIDNGIDISVEFDTVNRDFTTHYPRKGSDKSGTFTASLRSAGSSNLADVEVNGISVKTMATSVTILSAGSGAERQDLNLQDTSHTGGLVLEAVEQLPTGAGPGVLPSRAASRLAQLSDVLGSSAFVLKTGERSWVDAWCSGALELGDTIAVDVDWYWIQVSRDMRIVEAVLYPDTETMDLTVNLDAAGIVRKGKPSVAGWADSTAWAIEKVRQRPNVPQRNDIRWEVVDGDFQDGLISNKWPVPDSRMLSYARVTATPATSTDSTLGIYRNGTLVATVTMPAFTDSADLPVVVPFGMSDLFQGGVITAGAGAIGFTMTPYTSVPVLV